MADELDGASHLAGLNDAQKQAVLHTDGPLMVLAGAGAGKTRVIVHRILNLILSGVAPENILAVTFTNKAAGEMRDRVRSLLSAERRSRGAGVPFVSTFHSLGVFLLRENYRHLRVPKTFSIFDRADSTRLIKESMRDVGVDPKQFEPRAILSVISKAKGAGLTRDGYAERTGGDYFPELVAKVWEKYEAGLHSEKAFDFDDLLLETKKLLEREAPVRERYRAQWSHLHIDEYQDTNKVQSDIAQLLTGEQKNICVVGDLDQSIYGWRGAELKNLLRFERTYRNPTIVVLEENYRSTQRILHAANEIIKKNKFRKEKNLFTKNAAGEPISLYVGLDENDEAGFVGDKARELIRSGVRPSEIAVLYRANWESRVIEEAMLMRDIPYQVIGTKFFERKEVKDVLSYLRAALSPERFSEWKRVLNAPPRGIGKVTLLAVLAGKEGELPSGQRARVDAFRKLLARIAEAMEKEKPSAAVRFVIRESGLEEYLSAGSEEDQERLMNLKELVTLATRYDAPPAGGGSGGMEKFLDDAALATDQDELKEERDAVKLMTVHASKGLEFPYVFITGLEEGLFPHERDGDEGEEAGEEERRLFYVALTRAKKKVFLSYASMRTIFGSRNMTVPSQFIMDLPGDALMAEAGSMGKTLRTIYLD